VVENTLEGRWISELLRLMLNTKVTNSEVGGNKKALFKVLSKNLSGETK
jgi:hypothetical protein